MGIEETILRGIQNSIEQDVFGTLTNSTQTPELTLEDVKKAVDEINKSRTIYYRVSNHIPKTNVKNERIVYLFKHTREIMLHPDNLPDFIGNGSTMALAVCRAALMMKFGYLSDGG